MTVLYFTATGNCLYVAKRFGGTLLSIPQALKENLYEFNDKSIGVVCPVYCNKPPKIVLDFLSKAKLTADYKFLILTYGHTNFGAAALASELIKEHTFDYVNTILMVDNYLPVFDMDRERKIDKKIDVRLSEIIKCVGNKVKLVPKMKTSDRIKNSAAQKMFAKNPQLNDGSAIAVTDKCVGCGICAKVCPIGNFFLDGGVAKRKSEKCEFCLACANLCTNKAIICKYADRNPNARYRNENVTLCEIIKSNSQI